MPSSVAMPVHTRSAINVLRVQAIAQAWLPRLEQDRKAEAASVRLKAYCKQGFPEAPEGMQLLEDVEDAEAAVAALDTRNGGGRGGGGRGYGRPPPRGGRRY